LLGGFDFATLLRTKAIADERMQPTNIDARTVEGFGREWTRFDNSTMSAAERQEIFETYFRIFPWAQLPANAVGFDLGCGSGRWAQLVAPRVGRLHCIDASQEALNIAKANLAGHSNCDFTEASVGQLPFPDSSMDFGYSLGVLHHVPDIAAGVKACVAKLKRGAPMLLYLYYAFDNRPVWFQLLWRLSDFGRRGISRLPFTLRHVIADAIATLIYWPLARTARLLEDLGANVKNLPLAQYRRRTFYVMRTDALDRFGTALEQRFTKKQIRAIMEAAGLEQIQFSDSMPFWCAVGIKK
jgi:ubiquinone/menaquinone biosynthesis C-methylase UbiE